MVAELFYYWLGLGFAVHVMQSFRDPSMLSFFKVFFLSFYFRKMTGGRAVAGIKLAGSLVRILLSYKNHLAVNIYLNILAFRLKISGVF